MSRITLLSVAVAVASVVSSPVESRELQERKYTVVTRMSEEMRKAIFAEQSACRTDVRRKADEQFPEMTLRSGEYDPKGDVKRFRARSRFEDAGVAACERNAIEKHAIDLADLRSIVAEGACRQWSPLAGKPRC